MIGGSSSEWIRAWIQRPNERNRLIGVRKIVRFLETQNLIVHHVREIITAEPRFNSDIVVFAYWNESEAETLNFRVCSAVVFFSFNSKLRKRVGMSDIIARGRIDIFIGHEFVDKSFRENLSAYVCSAPQVSVSY